MIEVVLDLKLNAFLVNSTGDAGGLPLQMSAKTLRFACGRILSARQLSDDTPTLDFEFLGSASTRENKIEAGREFDEQLIEYLLSHTHIDISKVMIAFGDEGYRTSRKEQSGSEIGRLFIKELPNQISLDIALVIKQNEFDAIWELTTKQNVKNMIGTFVCFLPNRTDPDAGSEEKQVAAILASSLQMMPGA